MTSIKKGYPFSTVILLLICIISIGNGQFDQYNIPSAPINSSMSQISQNDSIKNMLFSTYRAMVQKASAFSDVALEAGISIDNKKIQERMAIYRKLYSGFPINKIDVKKQLLAEAYLLQSGEHQVSDVEVSKKLNSFSRLVDNDSSVTDESLNAVLKAEVLFSRYEVVKESNRQQELQNLKRQEIMAKAYEYWPLKEIRIKGEPGDCLVWSRSESCCILTIEEYNSSLSINRYNRYTNLDSVRIQHLKKYLAQKYYAAKAEENYNIRADSLLPTIKKKIINQSISEKTVALGRMKINDILLGQTYNKYYDSLFHSRDEVFIDVIGSSDSQAVDSIYHLLSTQQINNKKSLNDTEKGPEPIIPWITFKERDLPFELVSPTDTFFTGQFTAPIKTGFGYFICKLAKINHIKSVSLSEAHLQLVYLATRDHFITMDSVVDARAFAYYEKHLPEFVTPDTISLRAWLIPFCLKNNNGEMLPSLSNDVHSDTSNFIHMELSSLDLPNALQRDLRTRINNHPHKKFFGPLKGQYGQWYIMVNTIKKGRKTIPFFRVKDSIVTIIATPQSWDQLIPENHAETEVFNKVLRTTGLSRVYHAKKSDFDSLHSITDEDIDKMLTSGRLKLKELPADADNTSKYAMARICLMEQQWETENKEQKKMMDDMEINYELVFH